MYRVFLLVAEKLVSLSVLMSALVVGYMTMRHDVPLGLMVVLGQIHGVISHHRHKSGEEAGHLVVHKQI